MGIITKNYSLMNQIISFETAKCKGLFVVVPEFATIFRIQELMPTILHYDSPYGWDGWDSIDLPSGNWQLINPLPKVTEEQAAEVVDESSYHNGFYTNYTDKSVPDLNYQCPIAYTSFMTLIFSLNVPENSVVLIEKK